MSFLQQQFNVINCHFDISDIKMNEQKNEINEKLNEQNNKFDARFDEQNDKIKNNFCFKLL